MKRNLLLTVLLATVTFVAGCASNLTKREAYVDLNGKVTAADAAVLHYVTQPNCATNGNQQPCAKTAYIKRLAEATSVLGKAMDAYSATVRDPAVDQSKLDAAAVIVRNALIAVTGILAELGIQAAGGGA